jgi:predicted acyltransferase
MAGRIVSVDVMRGLTMAAMIVVNNPGSWAHMAAPLRHADWGAWLTPADLVFPFFLVLVGVATPLSLRKRIARGDSRRILLGRAARRAVLLLAIGLALNLFPHFDLATVRVPGVLQRIAVIYLVSATAFLWLSPRAILALVAVLLSGYTALLLLTPLPGAGVPTLTPDQHLPAWLDDRLLGAHTWRGPGDPEGVLSTLGAAANGLLGVLAGGILLIAATPRRQAARLAAGGALALATGVALTPLIPAVKEVWTASYALVTAGAALLALAALRGWLGGRRAAHETAPALAPVLLVGRQALLAYVLAHLVSDLSIHVLRWPGGPSLHVLVHGRLLASWLPPVVASAAYSLLVLVVVVALVAWLDRRGVRLRV